MELEKAISKLKYELDKSKIVKKYQGKPKELFDDLDEYIKSIETVLNHLTKQDKMIELMVAFIDTELSSEHLSRVLKIDVKPLETYRQDIKQYFEKKAEENL